MFVRWKRRQRTQTGRYRGQQKTGQFVLYAVLVASERRDGKPRQRIVAYLGSIRERCLPHAMSRNDFWEKATANLDKVGMDAGDREKVEKALQSRVPKPTAEETEKAKREFERYIAVLREMCEGRGRRRRKS